MQSGRNFTRLAAALSDTFTVYVPDRRGRGLSGSFGDTYGIHAEVDDLAALLAETGAHNVFGLSSGALITLQAALTVPAIRRIALYEPPLDLGTTPSPVDWVPGYEKDMANGNLAAAMVDVIKGTGDRDLLSRVPRMLLVLLFSAAMRAEAKRGTQDGPPIQALVPTVHFDAQLAAEMAGKLGTFRDLQTETLLLGGSRSKAYLTAALSALGEVLPNSRRIEFSGLGHIAADDSGAPIRVADELRRYFSR
jgi:pimeloyl-ACP methyl ester carboxylesterase